MRKAAPALSATQVSAATATAHAIAAALGASDIIRLEAAYATLQHAAAGPNWASSVYVATPQLLRAFGIMPSQVSPTADILTMRPGLSTLSKMQLLYGTPPCVNSSAGCPRRPTAPGHRPPAHGVERLPGLGGRAPAREEQMSRSAGDGDCFHSDSASRTASSPCRTEI